SPTEVMATPSFCTSLAPMCLSTSAACCSPSESRTIAARWTPVRGGSSAGSAIGGHHVADHLGDAPGVGADRGAGDLELLVEAHRRRRQIGRARLNSSHVKISYAVFC